MISSQRLGIARAVAAHAAKHEEFRRALAKNAAGEFVVLVASPNERIKTIVRRMRSVGLPVTVTVPAAGGRLITLEIRELEAGDHVHTDDVVRVADNITAKFLAQFVTRNKAPVVFHLGEPPLRYESDFEVSPWIGAGSIS